MKPKSSCTEFTGYSLLCEQAANDDRIFETFRNRPEYTGVVETVDYSTGKEYLNIVMSQSPEFADVFEKFKSTDKLGNPKVYGYLYGLFSPTTLRYIKVLSDLKNYFGSLNGMRIIEIGGGYGGQCKVISDLFEFESYTLVDLQPCLRLAKKYLDKLEVKNVSYCTSHDLTGKCNYDLVISNYAFSEITRNVQDIYIKKILNKSSRGYMLCNFITHGTQINSYTESELINLLNNNIWALKGKPPLTSLDIFSSISLLVWGIREGVALLKMSGGLSIAWQYFLAVSKSKIRIVKQHFF